MNIGIIGCGWVAKKHVSFIRSIPNAKLVGIVDNDPEQLKSFATRHKIKNYYSALDDLLASQQIDVLHIVTPPFSHKELAINATNHHIHVYIEKPIALNAGEVKEIYESAAVNGVKVCPGYNFLFDPIVNQAIEEIEKSEFGRVIYVESYYGMNMRRYDRLKTTKDNEIHWSYYLPGGFHQNYITHPIYMLLRFIGKPLNMHTECTSTGALPQDLTDEIRVIVQGENGMGLIALSYSCEPYQHYLKVFGEKQALKIDWRNMTAIRCKKPGLPDAVNRVLYNNLSNAFQLASSTIANVFNLATKKIVPYHGMKTLIELFYACVKKDLESPLPYDLVMATEEASDQIYKHIPKLHLNFAPRSGFQKNIIHKEKVLVTGSSGYIGLATVKRLVNEGYEVRAFVRKLSYIKDLEALGVEIYFGDIRHYGSFKEAAKGCDIIIHLAAALNLPESEYEEITVGGVRNLIKITEEQNISRVIYMGSMSVYDVKDTVKDQVLTEEHILERRPRERGAYSLSKQQAEQLVLKELPNRKPKWTILRPAVVFGPGKNIFIGSIGKSVANKVRIIFGRGDGKLRLIHVDDVVEGIILSLKNDKSAGKIYNIVHEDRTSKRDYINKYVIPLHGQGMNLYVPYYLVYSGVFCLELLCKMLKRRPFLTRYRLMASQKDVIFDSSKIRNDLGWKPKYPVDQCLKSSFNLD